MGIFKRDKAPAGAITLREGDHVSWRFAGGKIRTGEITAIAGNVARVLDDAFRKSQGSWSAHENVPLSALTLRRRSREDDKTEALTAVYSALRERADRGDLSAWTFLEEEWPALVPAELRALLNLGAEQADGAPAPVWGKSLVVREMIERASADGAEIRIVDGKTGEAPWTAA